MQSDDIQEHETDDKNFCLWVMLTGAVIVLSALPLSTLDRAVFECFENLGAASLESFMKLVTNMGTGVILGAAALLAFAVMRDRRSATRIALSLLLATIIVSLLKNLISRQRPTSVDLDSFPSGHSASALAVAAPFLLQLRKRGIPFIAVAGLIVLSRLFRSNHYLSDVLAGAGLGVICAGAAGLIVRKTPRFTRLPGVRTAAGFLAFGFAGAPLVAGKNTLGQLVLIVMPSLAFFTFWSYLTPVIAWMKKTLSAVPDKRLLVIIFAACVFLFLIGNWASTLFDRDEGWYAEIAREMMASGDYLTPAYNGKSFLEKPPLPYWLMAGSMSIFGQNAFGARFPSAVAGAGACVILFLLARLMFDRKTALASVVVFTTSLITLFVMRAALTDSILLLLLLVSFYGFWRIFRGDASRLYWLMLFGGAGLTFLTKYIAGAAIIGLAALLTIVFTRRWDVLKRARIPIGALLFLVIAGAWFLPANLATEGDVWHVFVEQNFGRSVSALQGHSGPFFYYIVLLPLLFFPWFSFLPAALSRRKPEIAPKSERWWLLVSWAGGTLLMFSVVSTKLPHYVFPALPPLAILVGSLIADRGERTRALSGWMMPFAYFFLGLIGFVLSIAIPISLEQGKFHNFWRFFMPACVILFLTTLLAMLDMRRRDVLRATVTLSSGMIIFIFLLVFVALPGFDAVKLAAPVGRLIAEKSRPRDAVLHWGYVEPSFTFYARRSMTLVRSHEALDKQITGADRTFCILPVEEADKLRSRIGLTYNIETLYPKGVQGGARGFNTGRGKWIHLELVVVERKPVSR
jgi:4-amino-4-deoxy-L-arabinose transferase-like glycosyltransferase/membrane-associated phospholipid phosphatase